MSSLFRFQMMVGVWVLAAMVPVQHLAFAGQSLVLTAASRLQTQLSNAPQYAALGNWRIEGLADQWNFHGARVGLWELDSSIAVLIAADNTLVLIGFHNESLGVPLGSIKSFRWVGQSNLSTGKYTLEVWDQETGAYLYAECAMASKTPMDRRNYRVSIGSFYEPAGPDIHLGYLRWFSSNRPVGGPPPLPLVPVGLPRGSPSLPDLMDFEFEGNLRDASGASLSLLFHAGQPVFGPTKVWPPSVNLGTTPLSARAGVSIGLDATASFSNTDSTDLSCVWEEVAVPKPGVWKQSNTCSPHYTPTVFGTYSLRLKVTDNSGQSSTRSFKMGSVVTDDNDVVVVADPKASLILGPMIRFGANPWSWFDNRQKALADNQLKLMDSLWTDYWNTPSPHGAVNVTHSSTTVTGVGTSFQTDFCGGPQHTTPLPTTSAIYIWYQSVDYPGLTGRGRYNVVKCDSQTQITLDYPYQHSANDSSRPYTVVDPQQEARWLYGSIPANYYDNVLAFYNLYYRTGIDTYRDAARKLASRFWTGPNWDRGQNYNSHDYGGKWFTAGPGRGQSVTGLILWSIDTGADIWKGMHYMWNAWCDFTKPVMNGGQMGSIREHGYFDGGLALCMLTDPDKTYSQGKCPAALHETLNTLWKPLKTSDGTWNNTAAEISILAKDGTVWVNVVDGSPNITLHNGNSVPLNSGCPNTTMWCTQMFTSSSPLGRWLWFINDPKNVTLPGNKTSDAGDAIAYKAAAIADGTHATLTTPYHSGKCPAPKGCNKGLVVTIFPGYGTQPFMLGLALGALGDYVYKALISQNMNEDAALVQNFVLSGSKWLATTGYDSTTGGLWSGRGFINCEPDPSVDPYCRSGLSLNGEATRGFSAGFLLSRDPSILAAGDALYQAQWCKPGGGWKCLSKPRSTYLSDVDDPPIGYMITNQAPSNKWLGFFFGYGFGSSWPAARAMGMATPEYRNFEIPVHLNSVPSAARMRAIVLQPSGANHQVICSGPPCAVKIDVRQGRPLIKIDYLSSAGKLLAAGAFSVLEGDR